MTRHLSLFTFFCWLPMLGLPLCAQSKPPAQAPRSTVSSSSAQADSAASAQQELQDVIDRAGGEPGAETRGLEAFLAKHPHPPEAEEIYRQLIKDATALEDDRRAVLYNEKLETLHPEDLGQRIKTLNLLLLERDPAQILQAQREAVELRTLVEQKAKETPPKELGTARWQIDMDRLRALAELMQGTADLHAGDAAAAQKWLTASLAHAPTEEAAAHLAEACEALHQPAAALDADALALALPGTTIAERAALRQKAGALYRAQHQGSDAGFGDLILKKFDEIAQRDAATRSQLHPQDAANLGTRAIGDFSFTALDGKEHQLKTYRGKVVVLDFWATWCGPCLVQHPIFEAVKKKFASNPDVVFVAVNTDEDRNRVKPFIAAHHWDAETWFDTGLGGYLGVDSLPTTMVLDAKGTIAFRQAGFDEGTFQHQLEAAITEALRGAKG